MTWTSGYLVVGSGGEDAAMSDLQPQTHLGFLQCLNVGDLSQTISVHGYRFKEVPRGSSAVVC